MHADLILRAGSDDALAAVPDVFVVLLVANCAEDLAERPGGAAGRIDLVAVVHLHDFEIEIRAEDLGGFAGEPEERVDAG